MNISGIQSEHLNASLQVIGVNVSAYYAGSLHAYRPIAAELRKLLCDTQSRRDISLFPLCFPEIDLHTLAGNREMLDDLATLYIPSCMSFDGQGNSEVEMLFNESGVRLPISEWLDQKFLNFNVTLRGFIRSVADKEAAHADKDMNDVLMLTKNVIFPGDETLSAKMIVAIARYIVKICAISVITVEECRNARVRVNSELLGRGVYVLDLHNFCHFGVLSFPLDFIDEKSLSRSSFNEPLKMAALQKYVDSYIPSAQFILMTIDLNRRGRSVYGVRF